MIAKGHHMGIELNYRSCPFCNDSVESEYHFVMKCPQYNDLRQRRIGSYLSNDSYELFVNILKSNDPIVLNNVALFVYHAFKIRENSLDNPVLL